MSASIGRKLRLYRPALPSPILHLLTPSSSQSTSAVYLKANLEYIRLNYRKAMKVLASAPKSPLLTDSGECLPSLYLNNLGCIHHQMGKHSLAAHYFSKALEENDSALNDFPPQDKGEGGLTRSLLIVGIVLLSGHFCQ